MTDRGPRPRFTLDGEENVRRLGHDRALIVDARGIRYLIAEYEGVWTAHSRRILGSATSEQDLFRDHQVTAPSRWRSEIAAEAQSHHYHVKRKRNRATPVSRATCGTPPTCRLMVHPLLKANDSCDHRKDFVKFGDAFAMFETISKYS